MTAPGLQIARSPARKSQLAARESSFSASVLPQFSVVDGFLLLLRLGEDSTPMAHPPILEVAHNALTALRPPCHVAIGRFM